MAGTDITQTRSRLNRNDQELIRSIKSGQIQKRQALTNLRARYGKSRRSLADAKRVLNNLNINELNVRSGEVLGNITQASRLLEQLQDLEPTDPAVLLLDRTINVMQQEYNYIGRRLRGSLEDYNNVNREIAELADKAVKTTRRRELIVDLPDAVGPPITLSDPILTRRTSAPKVSINRVGNFVVTRMNAPRATASFGQSQATSPANYRITQMKTRSLREHHEWEKSFFTGLKSREDRNFKRVIDALRGLRRRGSSGGFGIPGLPDLPDLDVETPDKKKGRGRGRGGRGGGRGQGSGRGNGASNREGRSTGLKAGIALGGARNALKEATDNGFVDENGNAIKSEYDNNPLDYLKRKSVEILTSDPVEGGFQGIRQRIRSALGLSDDSAETKKTVEASKPTDLSPSATLGLGAIGADVTKDPITGAPTVSEKEVGIKRSEIIFDTDRLKSILGLNNTPNAATPSGDSSGGGSSGADNAPGNSSAATNAPSAAATPTPGNNSSNNAPSSSNPPSNNVKPTPAPTPESTPKPAPAPNNPSGGTPIDNYGFSKSAPVPQGSQAQMPAPSMPKATQKNAKPSTAPPQPTPEGPKGDVPNTTTNAEKSSAPSTTMAGQPPPSTKSGKVNKGQMAPDVPYMGFKGNGEAGTPIPAPPSAPSASPPSPSAKPDDKPAVTFDKNDPAEGGVVLDELEATADGPTQKGGKSLNYRNGKRQKVSDAEGSITPPSVQTASSESSNPQSTDALHQAKEQQAASTTEPTLEQRKENFKVAKEYSDKRFAAMDAYNEDRKPKEGETFTDFMKRRASTDNLGRSETDTDTSKKFGEGQFNLKEKNDALTKNFDDANTPGHYRNRYQENLESGERIANAKARAGYRPADEFTPTKELTLDEIRSKYSVNAGSTTSDDEGMYSGTSMFTPKSDSVGGGRVPYTPPAPKIPPPESSGADMAKPDTSVPSGGVGTNNSVAEKTPNYGSNNGSTITRHKELGLIEINGQDL